ncbi:MAG TPA: PTS system mannose/fructose/sorbose family transporter subunit IID [Longimicrobiaceae bacterium]|nr:PTS system mannose/fructose/sorbose family transporter subunit IID [Longimicrobiaceae bacterium]
MTALTRGVRRALLLRSFAVQGSWNYQTLIGTGFAFVLLPVLRRVYRDDEDALYAAVARHAELFNSHPYLATVAAGAVARLEEEGAPPETVRRFKAALRGSLGSIGDRLVWQAWRPACALLAIALLLLGAPWWAAVAAFLLVYNALHLWLRAWGLRVGLRDGLAVGRALRDAPFQRLSERASDAGAFLAGMAGVLAVGDASRSPAEYALVAAALAAGLWLGLRVRWAVWAVLVVVWAVDTIVVATS